MSRRVTVFTGTRADYGLMRGVIALLTQDESIELSILASGAHLSSTYGNTLTEVVRDDVASLHEVDIELMDNSPAGICASMGKAMERYGKALLELKPDLLVVLGDRYEAFCAVSAASVMRVPVAHLYGGGTTLGAIDEGFRHAITKMSHLHFVSCEVNRQRVLQMGEDPERVWLVGSAGVENTHILPVLPEEEVRMRLQLPEHTPYVVITYHPVTLDRESSKKHVDNLLEVLRAQKDWFYVFTGANADAGGKEINKFLQDEALRDTRMRFFMSLGAELYINAARYASAVIGNSSSGVAEIPSLGIPVLDIGDRQKGRERSAAVLHCSELKEDIAKAVVYLRKPETAEKARTTENPLDIAGTSAKIAEVLINFPLDGLLKKKFVMNPPYSLGVKPALSTQHTHKQTSLRLAPLLRDEKEIAGGNRIILVSNDGTRKNVPSMKGLEVKFTGTSALVEIHDSVVIKKKMAVAMGQQSYLRLESDVEIGRVSANLAAKNGTLVIGQGTAIGSASINVNNEHNLEVIIGKNCLFFL